MEDDPKKRLQKIINLAESDDAGAVIIGVRSKKTGGTTIAILADPANALAMTETMRQQVRRGIEQAHLLYDLMKMTILQALNETDSAGFNRVIKKDDNDETD